MCWPRLFRCSIACFDPRLPITNTGGSPSVSNSRLPLAFISIGSGICNRPDQECTSSKVQETCVPPMAVLFPRANREAQAVPGPALVSSTKFADARVGQGAEFGDRCQEPRR